MYRTAHHSNPLYRAIDTALRVALRILPPTPLSERIALWWGYRFKPEPSVVTLRSGVKIRTTHLDHLQLLLYYLGTFEPQSLAYVERCTTEGGAVIDVGANIGLYTLVAARIVGPSGTVLSIEAAPSHAKSVAASVQLNGFTNCTIANIAVGDSDGEATLTLPRDSNFGMFTLGNVSGEEKFVVPVRRIDDLVKQYNVRSIDFIKMDIEGSEYRALIGAQEILRKYHPTILIELNEAALRCCGSSCAEVKALLGSFGYVGYLVGHNSLTKISPGQTHVCDETLYIHELNFGVLRMPQFRNIKLG